MFGGKLASELEFHMILLMQLTFNSHYFRPTLYAFIHSFTLEFSMILFMQLTLAIIFILRSMLYHIYTLSCFIKYYDLSTDTLLLQERAQSYEQLMIYISILYVISLVSISILIYNCFQLGNWRKSLKNGPAS